MVVPKFLWFSKTKTERALQVAYTFAYTPTLTTRRSPVYMALSWASALIILWSQVQVLVGPPATEPLAFKALVVFLLSTVFSDCL